MENKLSIETAASYSNIFVEKSSKKIFENNEFVTGEHLPKLTPIREINFLLIFILLQSWKQDTQKLKSPYFDFETDEVKQALETLMNTLSRNIRIEEENLKPLLKKSYQFTLLYFNNPVSFLSEIFNEKVSKTELTELNKFMKSEFIDSILEYLDENNESRILINEIDPTSLSTPDAEKYLSDLENILELEQKEDVKEEEIITNTFKEKPMANLNDSFEQNKGNTLNEQFSKKEEIKTILESHSSEKGDGVLKSIPLNEQYQITNVVFGGMKSVFDSFIQKLDDASTFADAITLLDEFVSKTEHKEQNEYIKELINRKFM